ncbi:hypothetical protein F5X96DRAFT_645445 [Biscogniauxia mediterranea]|nr:hypothetical protein F5X96DRAFT_645445 [Biscogniauxia mediterranea]
MYVPNYLPLYPYPHSRLRAIVLIACLLVNVVYRALAVTNSLMRSAKSASRVWETTCVSNIFGNGPLSREDRKEASRARIGKAHQKTSREIVNQKIDRYTQRPSTYAGLDTLVHTTYLLPSLP